MPQKKLFSSMSKGISPSSTLVPSIGPNTPPQVVCDLVPLVLLHTSTTYAPLRRAVGPSPFMRSLRSSVTGATLSRQLSPYVPPFSLSRCVRPILYPVGEHPPCPRRASRPLAESGIRSTPAGAPQSFRSSLNSVRSRVLRNRPCRAFHLGLSSIAVSYLAVARAKPTGRRPAASRLCVCPSIS